MLLSQGTIFLLASFTVIRNCNGIGPTAPSLGRLYRLSEFEKPEKP